jgi:hypothetical protein
MKEKIYRSLALAVLAAFSMNVAANADGCAPVKKVSHKRYRAAKRVAAAPQLIKETKIVTTKTIEKPVVIEAPAAPAPVAVEPPKQEVITQPAVCEPQTPVIIDRYQRRHRSLIHLGLFPFALFGE